MIGLSTRGSISFGCALVAGRKRVPRPAAGNTALRTFLGIEPLFETDGLRGYAGTIGNDKRIQFRLGSLRRKFQARFAILLTGLASAARNGESFFCPISSGSRQSRAEM